MFLFEVKFNGYVKVNNVISSISLDDFFLVPSTGSAGGIVLIWKSPVNIQILFSSVNFISALILNDDPLDNRWLLTGVYEPANPILKPNFWSSIEAIGNAYEGPWCIIGDFNVILDKNN